MTQDCALPHLDQRLCRRLFRRAGISCHRVYQAVYRRRHLLINRRERRFIPLRHAAQQIIQALKVRLSSEGHRAR